MSLLALVAFALLGPLKTNGLAGDFETANQAYDQGKYAEAKQAFEKLVETGGGSANVYYDLGNTDFRLNAPGLAILNYERALALQPHHPEAQANLKLLRERSGAKLLPLSWQSRIADKLSPNSWTALAVATGWIVLFGLAIIVTSRQADHFWLGTLALVCVAVSGVSTVALWSIAKDQTLGVIIAQQTEARLAPAESAGVAEALTAGSRVRVLSERGPWTYCELPGAGRGWIPNDAVERVRPNPS